MASSSRLDAAFTAMPHSSLPRLLEGSYSVQRSKSRRVAAGNPRGGSGKGSGWPRCSRASQRNPHLVEVKDGGVGGAAVAEPPVAVEDVADELPAFGYGDPPRPF